MNRSNIISKIKNLQDLAERGGTVEEGLAAAKKVMELIDKYQVDPQELEEVVEQGRPPVKIYVDCPEPRSHNVLLACILEGMGNVKIASTRGNEKVIFFSTSEDTAKEFSALWTLLVNLREANLKRAYRQTRKSGHDTEGFKTSYRIGYASAIRKLMVAHTESRTEETSTAMVLVSHALTAYYQQSVTGTKAVNLQADKNDHGYHAGYRKGEEVGGSLLSKSKRLNG